MAESSDNRVSNRSKDESGWLWEILDSINEAVFLYNPANGTSVYANKRTEELFGYTSKEIAKLSAEELLASEPPYTAKRIRDLIHQARTGRPQLFDWRVRDKKGELLWVELSICHTIIECSQQLVFTARNITERKLVEETLLRSEELYKSLLKQSPISIQILDPSGKTLEVNKAFEDLWGIKFEEMQEYNMLRDSQLEASGLMPYVKRAFSGEETFMPTTEYDSVDTLGKGYKRWVNARYYSVKDENGRVRYVILINEDVTERVRAEEALRLNESRLEALLQLSQISKASPHEMVEFALEEAVRLTGSTIGYASFVTEDQTALIDHAWSHEALKECGAQQLPPIYPISETGLWGEAFRQRKPIITNDYDAPNPWKKGCPEDHLPIKRHMNIPVFDGDRIVVLAGVGNKATDYDEADLRQLTLMMDGMWKILQKNRAEKEKQDFYRQTISSVTDGKLEILDADEIAHYVESEHLVVNVCGVEDVTAAREKVDEICRSVGMQEERLHQFTLAVGEAITNALKYASGGAVYAGVVENAVWVAVEDHGPGIESLVLPRAILRRGFSTKPSMGLGYSIMLDSADRILLKTGSDGTTVVLIKHLHDENLELQMLPDIWHTVPV